MRNTRVEFLLVRTRKGRWTFPKGGVEPGLTRAQCAALEAFEEAGVHGRIEEAPFARYPLDKHGNAGGQAAVKTFLCEVTELEAAQELNRDPTWFSIEKTKLHLREGRGRAKGDALAYVVDRAVTRIRRSSSRNARRSDSLQRVAFEASEIRMQTHMRGMAAGYIRRQRSGPAQVTLKNNRDKILRLPPPSL